MKKHRDLASFLKEARLKAGLSQREVARSLGYGTPQFISNWERGISTPPGRKLRRLSELYGVRPKELFEVLLGHAIRKAEEDLRRSFFGHKKNGSDG